MRANAERKRDMNDLSEHDFPAFPIVAIICAVFLAFVVLG